jgi:hypothetical protein
LSTVAPWAVSLALAVVFVAPTCLALGSFGEAGRPGGSIDLLDELLRQRRRNAQLADRQRHLAALILAGPADSAGAGEGADGVEAARLRSLRAAAEDIELDDLLEAHDAEIEAYLRRRPE